MSIASIIQNLTPAYDWLCARRKDAGPHHDVWHLRLHSDRIRPELEKSLNEDTFNLSPLKRYEINNEQIDCWCSVDSLVLKAIALFVAQRFASTLSKRCKHIKGHGGAQQAVTDVAQSTRLRTVYSRSPNGREKLLCLHQSHYSYESTPYPHHR